MQDGRKLPLPKTKEENTELYNFMVSSNITRIWIDLNDAETDGDFRDREGNVTNFYSWLSNQPQNNGSCVEMDRTYGDGWSVVPCHKSFAITYVCEYGKRY